MRMWERGRARIIYLYVCSSLGKSLNNLFPVARPGNGIEDKGKILSLIGTTGNGVMGSANSVSRENELNCGAVVNTAEPIILICPD